MTITMERYERRKDDERWEDLGDLDFPEKNQEI